MAIAAIFLLWLSLRRITDVAIVTTSLGLSLFWMYGLIGWAVILGKETGFEILRSQFSQIFFLS